MALIDELTNDPLAIGYAVMSDQACADALNEVNRATRKPVATKDIKKYLFLNDLWPALKSSADADAVYVFDALNILDEFSGNTAFAVKMNAKLDALITAGLITAQNKADIFAMFDDTVSRAEELGLGRVRGGDVQRARMA